MSLTRDDDMCRGTCWNLARILDWRSHRTWNWGHHAHIRDNIPKMVELKKTFPMNIDTNNL